MSVEISLDDLLTSVKDCSSAGIENKAKRMRRISTKSKSDLDSIGCHIIDVLHPGRPNVSKAELKGKLSRMYEVKDSNTILVFKFRNHFGGGKSTGFVLIYDTVENAKKYEPKYRLIRNGLDTMVEKSRKQMKERKNKALKIQGVKKSKASDVAKGGKKK